MARAERRIVVGYDGTPESQHAVQVAAHRAGRRGTLYVVHAYPPMPGLRAMITDSLPVDERARGEALLDGLLLAADEELLDTRLHCELVEGPAAPALVRTAVPQDADEIVVGARRLGRVRSLLGSVSRELLEIADRPVLIVPAPGSSIPAAPVDARSARADA